MSKTKPLWIIKLGGSLSYNPLLLNWLTQIYQYGQGKVVIVCGGGKFVDQVRDASNHWQLNETTSHHMALLGMAQFAHLIQGIAPHYQLAATEQEIKDILKVSGIPIWLPYQMVIKDKTIPCSWEMTSDSLALWLAKKLEISQVIWVKSIQVTPKAYNFKSLISAGIIDHCSRDYASKLSVSMLHVAQFQDIYNILEQEKMPVFLQ